MNYSTMFYLSTTEERTHTHRNTFIYILLSLEIQVWRGEASISLADLIPPHFCARPKSGHGFPTSMVRGYCSFYWYWSC